MTYIPLALLGKQSPYPNPYLEWMARWERVPSRFGIGEHYEERDGDIVGSCGEVGMNKLAECAVLYDEHIDVLMEYLHVKGAELCPDGEPLAFHEWSVNDYYDPPLFDLHAWHDRSYCIAVGYEFRAGGGHFFPWADGIAVLRERRLTGRG